MTQQPKTNCKQKPRICRTTVRTSYDIVPATTEDLGVPGHLCGGPGGPPARLCLIVRVEAWVAADPDCPGEPNERRPRREAAPREDEEREREARLRQAEEWVRSIPLGVRTPLPNSLLQDARQWQGRDYLSEKALHSYVRLHFTDFPALKSELRHHEFRRQLRKHLEDRTHLAVSHALLAWGHPDAPLAAALPRDDSAREFDARYPAWREALPEAAAALARLDRFTPSRDCPRAERLVVQRLKEDLLRLMYEEGLAVEVRPFKSGRAGQPFVGFRFEVGGETFAWSLRRQDVYWPLQVTEEKEIWGHYHREQELLLSREEFERDRRTLAFVITRFLAERFSTT